jgi:putative ABC transport system permease protein
MRTILWDTIEAAQIAFQSLLANKIRTFLATLGIVIGVMTVVLMVTIVAGLNQSFKKQLAAIGSGTIYIQRFPWIIQDDFFIYRNRPRLTMENYEDVRDQSRLAAAVSPQVDTMRPIAYGSSTLDNAYIIGTNDTYLQTTDVMPEVGRFISASDYAAHRNVAVIGTDIASKLFGSRNPIGQYIKIGARDFLVIGVLEKQGSMFGMSLDSQVIVPIGAFMKQFGRRRDLGIIVKAANPDEIQDLKDEITGIMRRSRRIPPDKENNFSINEQEQLMSFYKQITSGVYAAGILIGGISLLVGGIGIMNIMLVSVTERTPEIGIRKALGARRSQILRQFLIESALICTVGGTAGILLAFAGAKIINQWLPTSLPPIIGISGILFAAFVGILSGLYPAAKAALLDPIVALRKE